MELARFEQLKDDSAPMIKIEAFVPSRVIGRVIAEIERILPPARVRRRVVELNARGERRQLQERGADVRFEHHWFALTSVVISAGPGLEAIRARSDPLVAPPG